MGFLGKIVVASTVIITTSYISAPAFSAARPPGRLESVCRRLDAAWGSVRTFQANLRWPNPRGEGVGEPGCGLVLFSRPDRWLMEFHTPEAERYLVNGDEGWVYVAKLNQVVHYLLRPEERAQVGLMILAQPTSELRKHYDLSLEVTPGDRGAMKVAPGMEGLVLTPRHPGNLVIRRAVMFLDPRTSLPRKVRLQLESGTELKLELYQERRNSKLGPELFQPALPDSVRVIEA